MDVDREWEEGEDEEEEGEDGEKEEEQEAQALHGAQRSTSLSNAVSDKMSNLASRSTEVVRHTAKLPRQSIRTTLQQLLVTIVVVLALSTLYMHKSETTALGYCDTGSDTNALLEQSRLAHHTAKICNAKLIQQGADADQPEFRLVDGVICPLESLIPLPPPDTCTPCPSRGTCADGAFLSCVGAYITHPHPFLSLFPAQLHSAIGSSLNGMPYLGSIAFPPTCIEDRRWLKNVRGLEKKMEQWLARVKGEKLCNGEAKKRLANKESEAIAWGVRASVVDDMARSTLRRTQREADIAGMIGNATENLEKHGAIVSERHPQT